MITIGVTRPTKQFAHYGYGLGKIPGTSHPAFYEFKRIVTL